RTDTAFDFGYFSLELIRSGPGRVLINPLSVSAAQPMSASLRKRTNSGRLVMSALCHKPTYAAQQIAAYPVTSSAMASGVGGTVRPSIRAVLRIDHQLGLVP